MKVVPISADNSRNLKKVADLKHPDPDANWNEYSVVAFSPGREEIVWGPFGRLADAGELALFDYPEERAIGQFPMGGFTPELHHIEFSPCGGYLAAVGEGTLNVWQAVNQRLLLKQAIRPAAISYLRFLAGEAGPRLLVAHNYEIRVFDVSPWQVREKHICRDNSQRAMRHVEGPVVLSRDASRLAGYGDCFGSVGVWNLQTESLEWSRTAVEGKQFHGCCFHPSESLLAVGEGNRIVIHKIPEGEIVCELRLDRGSFPMSLTFSPDGQILASISGHWDSDLEDMTLDNCVLWDWEWGTQLVRLPSVGGEKAVFSGDGSRLATISYEGSFRGLEIWGASEVEKAPQSVELPKYDNQGREYGHPNYGDDW